MVSKTEKQIRTLWRDIFGDNEEFIKMYFKRVYKDEYALAMERDGRIVSSLMLLPYSFNYYGATLPMGYIVGACTLPAERGRGWMKRLMDLAVEEMKRRGMAMAALIPASPSLFDFYERHGFTRAFDFSLCTYSRSEYNNPSRYYRITRIAKFGREEEKFFNRKLKERLIGVLHGKDDVKNIFRDNALAGGKVIMASREGGPCGMAFATPARRRDAGSEERSALARELLYDDESIKQALLHAVSVEFGVERVMYRRPYAPELAATYCYGMARVINAELMIDIRRNSPLGEPLSGDLPGMDIRELTSALLDYPNRRAYMSLMMD
jgi:GNAT superfamily N-acetyltransferase